MKVNTNIGIKQERRDLTENVCDERKEKFTVNKERRSNLRFPKKESRNRVIYGFQGKKGVIE